MVNPEFQAEFWNSGFYHRSRFCDSASY